MASASTLQLDRAYAQLNIELEFFWKRATYFSTIIGLIIAGIATIHQSEKLDAQHELVLCALAAIGWFISLIWWLANKGSKYWYEQWEAKVQWLEMKNVQKSLYTCEPFSLDYPQCFVLKKERISVTKCAIILSFFMILFFALGFEYFFWTLIKTSCIPFWFIVSSIFILLSVATKVTSAVTFTHKNTHMLQLRPNCECCNKDLPPDSLEARICSFECTFCAECVETVLKYNCPNCGGELVRRPVRPAGKLANNPPSTERVFNPKLKS